MSSLAELAQVEVRRKDPHLAFQPELPFVCRPGVFGNIFVVTCNGLVRVFRNSILKGTEIPHPDEAVPNQDTVIEEAEWLCLDVALQPERHLAKLHRKWILIDAVDAIGDHIPQGNPILTRTRLVLPAADFGEFVR